VTLTALPAPRPETMGQRVQRLQAEARGLARSHVAEMMAKVAEGLAMAADIADGGDAYPPGVREASRKLTEDGESLLLTLTAIIARTK